MVPRECLAARDDLVIFEKAADVLALQPDFAALAKLPRYAVIASAPGTDGVDFVSRFFAPKQGIPEDPVTGYADCTLAPYWADRLGKRELRARPVRRRVGELSCELDGDRVRIGGACQLVITGTDRQSVV